MSGFRKKMYSQALKENHSINIGYTVNRDHPETGKFIALKNLIRKR
jgi:hypothetical protein